MGSLGKYHDPCKIGIQLRSAQPPVMRVVYRRQANGSRLGQKSGYDFHYS